MKKALLLLLSALLLATLATGCLSIQEDPNSDLPSNAPASWEGKSLGVPL
jgi:integral membrane sensor domain MASE1